MKKGSGKSFDGGPVGYKRPPVEHQFKKGQKPPGSGRRPGSKNMATIMEGLLDSRITVMDNGKTRRMTVREAIPRKAIAKALNGNASDLFRLMQLIERIAPIQMRPEPAVIQFQLIEGDDW